MVVLASAMRVYLSRWVCLDVESNLRRLVEEASSAAQAGAELAVFPESFLHGYTQTVEPARVRRTFAEISAENERTSFVFGSFTEERRNRMTVWRGGCEIARYDKVHLFAPNRERELWQPGDRYAAVRLNSLTVGLINCNDLRFPEQARTLRLKARADLLVVVAWWPWRRDHVWRTLLRARAIENATWVLGCCLAQCETADERFAGAGNYAFDPLGEPVRTSDDRCYELALEQRQELIVDPLADAVEIEAMTVFNES